MSISISIRNYLSINHLSAAALFASQCRDNEGVALTSKYGSKERRQHNAYAVSSVILSAAFLEATINELFSDCADDHITHRIATLEAMGLMGRLWKRDKGIPRTASYSILDKYEIALELNGKTTFNQGASSYQNVKLLVELRNTLVHFEPETVTSHSGGGAPKLHKFEKRFAGKFDLNPLFPAGNPFFPDRLLGAGCANWAVTSAVAFTDEFFAKLGMKPTYDHVRGEFL